MDLNRASKFNGQSFCHGREPSLIGVLLDICAVLGFEAAWAGSLSPTFRHNLSVLQEMGLIGCPVTSVITNLSCVKFQKSAVLIDTAAEACNQAGVFLI